ncbi:BRCA2-interacting transcriptional repressor EMSY isoform X5 [Danio rerio]|uniref:BRCA2-interacting transcriptional repressor EMSY isoform X5 n=4 Tax=Danio rerio TaxID=7955 RepID=A0AC58GIW8_DANRE|nr:BRCA2-interacting transcriptional repressor EMSY isoform X4 [Danio rerio]|eukprot:XP_009303316.1 BRCA2-interacting transcriptional repressor EMSY isoform X4 [Danio rerio]
MIQQEKPLAGSMPVVWPTLLDLSRDECKRILRKLELEAYAGVISALRAQGDLTKDKKELLGELTRVLSISTERHRAEVRRAVNDERLTTIAHHMSGPNSSSEWSIEGRRLVPLMPRLVPQTAFTVMANAVANATAHQNASLPLPAETANKEVVVCYSYTSTTSTPPSASAPSSSSAAVKSPRPASPASNVVVLPSGSTVYVKSVSCSDEDEKPRKRRRTSSSSSSPVLLKEVPKVAVTAPGPKTITLPVSGGPKISNLMQSIANSLPPHMSPVKITFTKPSTQTTNTTTQKVIIVTTSPSSNFVPNILSKSHNYAAVSKLVSSAALTASSQKQTMVISAGGSSVAPGPGPVAVTTVVSSTPSVVMSTVAQGVKIITQQMQPSKILPKPSSAALPSSSSAPIMVVSSNGAIMTTKLVSTPTGSASTYTRPTVSPMGTRVATSPAGATYVKTTSGSIITVVPKALATLGGKIITTSMVSGTTTKITTIPMTSKPNVIVVQKTTGKGTTIQGLPGKNVVTTLLNAGGEKTLQAIPGAKPAIITASRPITKMIVTQPKSLGAGVQPSTTTKIIPTKIVYGQQGKTQVLIKPKPMAFQTAVVSEQTRQLVSETLQQVNRSAENNTTSTHTSAAAAGLENRDDTHTYTEGSPVPSDSTHDAPPVVHLISSRGQEWAEQEVSVESSPALIYQELTAESQSATSTIKALLELQQTSVKEKSEAKPRQHTIDLSQMAVPIPVSAEQRESPEPSGQSAAESDAHTEFIPIGKVSKAAEVSASSTPGQSASAVSAAPHVVKISTAAVTTQQVEAQVKPQQEQVLVEECELEGDTLDPQTGLFYRSSPQQQLSRVCEAASSSSSSSSSSSRRAEPPLTVKILTHRSSSSAPATAASANTPHTPQLPRLQQAPTTHNRPNTHTQLSQPPPLQAHHPVGSSKTSSGAQVQQPIITQGATVTKITFGAPHVPRAPVSSSSSSEAALKLQAESSSEKPSVSDILKISMMEAEIDPGAEPMLVDSSSDCGPLTKAPAGPSLISSSKQTLAHGPFSRKSKELDIIQVIPQYSIMPDSSQSNVVVEPSGFLEISDYTSQRLDEEQAMEQEVDSSNDEGAAASPSADQSQ